jgi:hypothetical protein
MRRISSSCRSGPCSWWCSTCSPLSSLASSIGTTARSALTAARNAQHTPHTHYSLPERSRLQSVRAAAKGSPILIIGTHAEHERCTEEYLAEMQRR